MGTFILGRVGLEGPTTGEVDGWSESGARVTVSGHTSYGSVEESLVLRSQFMGLVDSPDESFVPVVWSEQPEVDGYYRVLDVQFDSSVERAPFGVLDWRVSLVRVLGYAAPLLELMTAGARRASSHLTGTQGVHLFAVPDSARSITLYNLTTDTYNSGVAGFVREGATGDVRRIGSGGGDDDPRLVQFYLTPDGHYAGAASLFVGDSLHTAVGRQIRNTPTAWRLSNGLLQVEPVASTEFDLRLRMWLSATAEWSPWVSFSMVAQNPRVPMPVPHAITVLRNGPEEVAIRLSTTTAPTGFVPVSVDFSLKRGARHVAVELRSTAFSLFGFRCASFAAATFVTTDEDRVWKAIGDVHMVMMAPYVIAQSSNDVHPNEGGQTNVLAWSFGFGMVESAVSATDDHQKVASEYFFASAANQSVVAL